MTTTVQNSIVRIFSDLTPDFRVYFDNVTGKRQCNEDNYLVLCPAKKKGCATAHMLRKGGKVSETITQWPADYARFAVADGMGGHAGGQEIAQAAVEELLSFAPARSVVELQQLVHKLHKRLYNRFANNSDRSPGTTLVLVDLCLVTGRGFLATVGDSRAYSIAAGKHRQLTHDHTCDEFDWRDQVLPKAEYERRLQHGSTQIVQALGNGSFGIIKEADGYRPNRDDHRIRLDLRGDLPPELATHADVFEILLDRGRSIMLASDGLWSADSAGRWFGLCSDNALSLNEPQLQIQKALDQGSKDNITVVFLGYSERNRHLQ